MIKGLALTHEDLRSNLLCIQIIAGAGMMLLENGCGIVWGPAGRDGHFPVLLAAEERSTGG